MKLNKYSQSKEGSTVIGSFSSTKQSSGSSASRSTMRELWGQHDTGDDIDGDMTVNGNVYIGEVEYDEDEVEEIAGDTEEKEPLHEFPTENGNLFASGSVESPEVYGNDLFLDYEDEKTNVLDLLKTWKEQILEEVTKNAASDDIFGSASRPVVLMAGTISREGFLGARYWNFQGAMLPCMWQPSISVQNGLMQVETFLYPEFAALNVVSVNVTQAKSGDTQDLTRTEIYEEHGGAHWFEARWEYGTIYIREFHKDARGNQSWASSDWNSDDCVSAINITVVGWVVK